MRRVGWFGLVLVAFVAVGVSAARAELPVWLVSGVSPTADTEILMGEELTIVAISILGTETYDCSFDWMGVLHALDPVTGDTDLLFTSVLNLAGTEVNAANPLECTDLGGLCPGPLLVPLNLEWLMELELMASETLGLLLTGGIASPGFETTCMGNGVKLECFGEPGASMTNGISDVTGTYNQMVEKTDKEGGVCNGAGPETYFIVGVVLIEATNGLVLSISEEP